MEIINFTPLSSTVGGALIGLAASLLLLTSGRIMGISGILKGAAFRGPDWLWRTIFLVSTVLSGSVAFLIDKNKFGTPRVGDVVATDSAGTIILLLASGLLVGFGTQLGSGCTSGHGVCGLARFSIRSLVAVLTFMATGFATSSIYNATEQPENDSKPAAYPHLDERVTPAVVCGAVSVILAGLFAYAYRLSSSARPSSPPPSQSKGEKESSEKKEQEAEATSEGKHDHGVESAAAAATASGTSARHSMGGASTQPEHTSPLLCKPSAFLPDGLCVLAAAAACGILFGIGVAVSGMCNPMKVTSFLDPFQGSWDPSLAFVMAGAVCINVITFRFILRLPHPLLVTKFSLPTSADVTSDLVIGAALFGIGWGLAGFCPGPAVASIGTGRLAVYLWLAAVLCGFLAHAGFSAWRTS